VRCGADDELTFFTSQMLASVADKHSHITDQSTFDLWRKTLKLDEPEVFLKKLSGAVDQLVNDKWWIDRDKIKKKLDNENKRHSVLATFYRRLITVELQSIKRHFTQHFVNKARICIHKQTHNGGLIETKLRKN
jgi:hypothetical protein